MSAMQGRPTDPDDDVFSARSEVEYDEYAELEEEYDDEEEDLEFEDEFEDDDEDEHNDWDAEFEDYELEEQHEGSSRKRRRENWE
jgi:hypothetical protein